MIVSIFLDGIRERELAKLKNRFWKKVKKTGTCWVWLGAKNQNGRGLFRVGQQTSGAPRIAWELEFGPIPEGLFVLHTVCDNPSCCRPEHLRIGTHSENMSERDLKGRTVDCGLRNRKKTRCLRGHLFDQNNTRTTSRGRTCKTCHREQAKLRYQRLTIVNT